MDRIAAHFVRWGIGLWVAAVISYFMAQSSVTVAPEDDIGFRMGIVIMAVGSLLILSLLVAIGVIGLWYTALSKRSVGKTPYENERLIGTAFVAVVFAIITVIAL